jgi:nucleoside-diphosphate-sugar epimerase
MNILITGGLGLIGHNVAEKLEGLGHNIAITDTRTNYGCIPTAEIDYLISQRILRIQTSQIHAIDISSMEGVQWLFQKYRPELVIHLASFPRQKVVNASPQMGSRAMSEGLLNLLEAAKQYKTKKFVYTSSSMVYGDFADDVTEDAVCRPQGQYGILKLAGEWLIRDYQRVDIAHTILRPSAVYGPTDVEDRVISKFLLKAMRGETLKVNGVTETLDFTYVDDAAQGIVDAALSSITDNQTYNITKSHSTTLLAAAEMAVKLAGSGNIEVADRDKDYPSRGALNIDRARRDFGFDPRVDVAEGFEIYYNWLKNDPYFNS